jgi:hypothetical protein
MNARKGGFICFECNKSETFHFFFNNEKIRKSIKFSLISTEQNLYKDIPCSYLWTYDLYYHLHHAFDADKSITKASGRGVGPWKSRLFWAL